MDVLISPEDELHIAPLLNQECMMCGVRLETSGYSIIAKQVRPAFFPMFVP